MRGHDKIERLLAAYTRSDRLMVATAPYTGLRISELLGLIWDAVLAAGVAHAHSASAPTAYPARRVARKTPASLRRKLKELRC